ncbi:MAG: low molecular weight protein arginine phosphatase [Candidatus Didemnitutus sp.]|nr:low molecular weight protein arginine phosphatase [Candidatus Didemnitutus sp.]
MPKIGSIIIVCTANICRSPMAEGLLAHALTGQEEPLRSIRVLSAGVAARVGDRVSENSVLAMKKVGIDIAAHRAQPLTQELLDDALAVFCMTESHRTVIELQATPPPAELHLLRDFLPPSVSREIADPFGGPLRLYEASRDEMVEAIPSLLAHLRKLVAASAS